MKYFRNVHFANAKYKEAGGLKISLPLDVRWKSGLPLRLYQQLVSINCEEHRNEIDISAKVRDLSLKRNVEDLVKRLQPISIAYRETLLLRLKEDLAGMNKTNFQSDTTRHAHFLAYLMHPKYRGEKLSEDEKERAMEFANTKYG